jgi:hypothetical protein
MPPARAECPAKTGISPDRPSQASVDLKGRAFLAATQIELARVLDAIGDYLLASISCAGGGVAGL